MSQNTIGDHNFIPDFIILFREIHRWATSLHLELGKKESVLICGHQKIYHLQKAVSYQIFCLTLMAFHRV
jgi:hypothetical protein